MNDEVNDLKKILARERTARKEAERILEQKSLDLFRANEMLREMNQYLEAQIQLRNQELVESERRLKFALEEAGGGMWEYFAADRSMRFSPRFKQILGYELAEFPDSVEFWTSLIHPDDLSTVLKLYDEYTTGERTSHALSLRLRMKDGHYKWVFDQGKSIATNDAAAIAVIGVNTDISQQKETETQLQLVATRLSHMITNLNSGILLEDEFRKIELVNETFCELFGIPMPAAQLVGEDCMASVEQVKYLFKDPDGFVKRINQLLTNCEMVVGDELEMVNGHFLKRDYVPFFMGDSYKGHLWKYTDITSNKLIEIRLKRQEEKYRGIIANMNLGLLEVDNEQQILYANQSFCEISGYRVEELIGRYAPDVLVAGDYVSLLDEKNKLREVGHADVYEIPIRNKRGDMRWWLISGAPFYDNHGVVMGSVGIHLDITAQKETEHQLIEAKKIAEASSQAKQTLMANMSHEIRTPMNAISGLGKQLLKTPLNTQQRSFVDAMNAASENLLVVINDILDVSKIEAGKMSIEQIPFSLKQVIQSVMDILLIKAEEKGIYLKAAIDPDLEQTHLGDPFRISQVLINLIGNSIKFTERGGVKIAVMVGDKNQQGQPLTIRITDTGIGMSEEFQKQLFEKFKQEEESTARTYGGSGLGLNITRDLLLLMGGEISIQSDKNKGTVFTLQLTLPVGTKERRVEISEQQEVVYDFSTCRILLAEDNPLNLLLVTTILERQQATFVCARNGLEVLDILEKEKIDLVLMDVQMPVLDGLQCSKEIRKKYGSAIPIIALTANAISGEKENCLKHGMNDFLSKPFEEHELLQKIATWIKASPVSQQHTLVKIDLTRLTRLAQGDQKFIQKMLQVFVNDVSTQLVEMKKEMKAQNYKKLAAIAHRIKPSVTDLGIVPTEIQSLERLAQEGVDQATIVELTTTCHDAIEEAIAYIRETHL